MADLDWSPQQIEALDLIRRWLDDPNGSQLFYLAGFAGTGKTTLAKEINAHVGGRALAAAYTGKAASVMSRKGLPASTCHRLAYTPIGNDDSKLRELKEELHKLEAQEDSLSGPAWKRLEALRAAVKEAEAQGSQPRFLLKSRDECDLTWAPLLILDEVSMCSEQLAEDLLSFGCRVLCLGDPAQLPPVKSVGYFTNRRPDYLLSEIHRQALDNPILRLATLAREGKSLPLGVWETDSGSARVVRGISATEALAANQILCGLNAKRRAMNARVRQLQGHAGHPMPRAGEKLMALRNDHQAGILNGTQWLATADAEWEPGDSTVSLTVAPLEGGVDMTLAAEASIFIDEDQKPMWSDNQQFTWGAACTVHRAQGSEWDDVILFDDWPRRDSRKEFLYTGVTRAAEHLTVVVE